MLRVRDQLALCRLLPNTHRRPILLVASFALLACVLATSPASGEDPPTKYVMSFDRQKYVGERYKLTCSYKSIATATFAGPERRDPWKQLLTAKCEGTWTTLAIGTNSEVAKISLTIERFIYQVDDGPEQSLPPGRIITAEMKDGITVYSMNVGEVPDDVRRVLNEFMAMPSGPSPSEDERWGTKVPRGVGEEWPVSASATAASFSSRGSNVEAKDVNGTVKLSGLRDVDGLQCFVIDDDYRIANVTPKAPMVDRLDIVSDFHNWSTVLLPTQGSRRRVGCSSITEWTHRFTWKPRAGSATPVVETLRVESDEHTVPLGPAQ